MKKYIFWIVLLLPPYIWAQNTAENAGSIKTGIGFGYNEGKEEVGMGLMYSIGWQKAIDSKQRLRINPNILFGGFTPLMITDQRNQYIRSSNFGVNLHYDLLKGRALSLFAMVGVYGNYTRGLMGEGELNKHSEYYHQLYAGGTASFGLRVFNPTKRLAYELRPLTFQYGNNQHLMGYIMFSIDFQLRQ